MKLQAGIPITDCTGRMEPHFRDYLLEQDNAIGRPGVTAVADTTYTLTASDETNLIKFTSASNVTVTVPANSTAALPVGYTTHIHQHGAGTVTLSGEVGVTLNSSRSLATATQYAALSLFKVDTDEWAVIGDQL